MASQRLFAPDTDWWETAFHDRERAVEFARFLYDEGRIVLRFLDIAYDRAQAIVCGHWPVQCGCGKPLT